MRAEASLAASPGPSEVPARRPRRGRCARASALSRHPVRIWILSTYRGAGADTPSCAAAGQETAEGAPRTPPAGPLCRTLALAATRRPRSPTHPVSARALQTRPARLHDSRSKPLRGDSRQVRVLLAPTAAVALVVAHRCELRSAGRARPWRIRLDATGGVVRPHPIRIPPAPQPVGLRVAHSTPRAKPVPVPPAGRESVGRLDLPAVRTPLLGAGGHSSVQKVLESSRRGRPGQDPISTCRSSAISPPQWSAYSTQDHTIRAKVDGATSTPSALQWRSWLASELAFFSTGQGRGELAADWHPRTGCVAGDRPRPRLFRAISQFRPHGPQAGRAT